MNLAISQITINVQVGINVQCKAEIQMKMGKSMNHIDINRVAAALPPPFLRSEPFVFPGVHFSFRFDVGPKFDLGLYFCVDLYLDFYFDFMLVFLNILKSTLRLSLEISTFDWHRMTHVSQQGSVEGLGSCNPNPP